MRNKILITLAGALLLPVAVTFSADPEQPATVVFDVDDVVVKRTVPVKGTLWKNKWNLAWYGINPVLGWRVYTLRSRGASVEEIHKLFKKDAPELAKMINKIQQGKKPIPGTVSLIQQLNDRGYTLRAATNMNKDGLNYLEKRYPEIFGLMKSAKYATTSKKPNHDYFRQLFNNDCKDDIAQGKTIVFTDDKPENVQAFEDVAKKMGIKAHGILFISPEQLQEDLSQLGIQVDQLNVLVQEQVA